MPEDRFKEDKAKEMADAESQLRRTPSLRRTKLKRRYFDRRDDEDERRKPPSDKTIDRLFEVHDGDLELLKEIEDDKE